jgi:hypothetical protein
MTIIVVSGALANKPRSGGEAWVRLSYVLGLRKLGYDARFVEQIAADTCTDAALAYFDSVTGSFGLEATLLGDDGEILRGPGVDELLALAGEADLLLNISGNLTWEPLFSRFRRRAYLDIDPGYTQLWHSQGHPVGRLSEHDVHFTVGMNVGAPGWPFPDAGVPWRTTLPPVVLDEWPRTDSPGREQFTTVGSWRGGYGRIEHEGVLYGQKAHEFRKLADLPRRARGTFELALQIGDADEADRHRLEERGWRLVDPLAVADTPETFRRYVQGSGAELSPAQGLYVETRCGWFSDRTARYLASGRPAVVQDTGLGASLPTGEGLLTFATLDEAVERVEHLGADYERHSDAARAFAEAYLDSDRVLVRLLEEAGVGG